MAISECVCLVVRWGGLSRLGVILFPDTLSLGHKEHAVNTEKYVYCRKVQKAMRFMTEIGN